jgi:hypothetical protein
MVKLAQGFPGRVRALYRRIDKLKANGKSFVEITDEIRPIVGKYLTQRIDVLVYGVLNARRRLADVKEADLDSLEDLSEAGLPDNSPEVLVEMVSTIEEVKKMVNGCNEADALMLLRLEYFHCGLTFDLCLTVTGFRRPPHVSVAALHDLIDNGSEKAPNRKQRIAAAIQKLQDMGAEVPETV